jgi:heme-degrading monooxygenase HmoA
MVHVRLGVYRFQPGSIDTVIERGQAELLPLFREQPGFVAYEVVRSGADTGVSISHWMSSADAKRANATAQTWLRDNFAPLLVSADQ